MPKTFSSQSREVLEQIIENALDAFVVINAESTVIAWTRRAEALFGWSNEEAVGKVITELIVPPSLREAHFQGMRRYLSTGAHVVLGKHVEIFAQHKDGHVFPVELSISLIDVDGPPIFSAALRDITERKAVESQLHATFTHAAVGIMHLAAEGGIRRVNAKLCEILEQSPEELGGRSLEGLAHPEDREVLQSNLQALLEGATDSRTFELRLSRKGGGTIWAKATASLMQGTIREGRTFILVFNDITENKILQERAERLAKVIEETPDFVGFSNLRGEAQYINSAGRKMVGLPLKSDLQGVMISHKYPAWAYKMVQQGIQRALEEGTWIGNTALISASGKEIPTSQVIIAHRDQKGEPTYLSTIIRDMTERHEIEHALREADRRKDEFLAMLAHELRNPLAPISTAAQILKLKGLEASRVRQATEIIARQAQHMTELIEDLLDVSRVTRGLIKIEKMPVDLEEVIADAVDQVRPLIETRHHLLVVRPAAERIRIEGDRTRLVQILANLLNNAAKYTPEHGRITLEVRCETGRVEMAVRDNGTGIPADMMPVLFDLFTQGKRTPDRSQGGLGLGLALVKSLVELHGGSVRARSGGAGQGSEFTVTLPRLPDGPGPESSNTPPLRQEACQALRILVVDDNEDAAQTLALLLESQGHEVRVAHSAREGLEKARARPPQVMLLDIGLPDMTGYELAGLARAEPGLSGTLLIAVTGYGQLEDVDQARKAGFAHHLLKPIDAEKLDALLRSPPPVARH